MSTIRIHTTQNVTLEYQVASLGERIVAAIIDNLILFAWLVAWVLVFSAVRSEDVGHNELVLGIVIFIVGIPYVFYHLLCEIFFNGQSLGKKARHIKVMRLDGTAPRVGDYLMRWLLRIIDTGFMGGLVAIITIAASGRGQRLGDMAAGTTVIRLLPRAQQATLLAPETSAPQAYQVVFPEAARLADHDVATIRQILHQATSRENYMLLNEVANKVKALTGIQTTLQDLPFLHTVLRDHAYLAANS
ncbi:RDD family protein [Hymenobacter saemangeumensis]|uniref:RDD family protein n=1 Tax=Hymenobacter saemangeumensis TaxID=1084522 RepID=A0ABP8IS18_9BACT